MLFDKGDKLLLSTSGGKDSTAMILYAKEIGMRSEDLEYVFMDTGWESTKTYEYLDYLEHTLNIEIHRIRAHVRIMDKHKEVYEKCLGIMEREYSDFVALMLNKGMFPSGAAQYCTGNLKVKPFNKFLESRSYEPISCVGIRREESVRRRDYKEWEYNDGFDVWVWRPIIDWTEQDVIDCHKRWNVKPNPLYLEGSHRVGCFPCIRSNKKELSEFPMEHKHIHVLRILEEYHSTRREKEVSFFRQGNIDSVLDWSRTQHGGKQYMLFNSNTPTCEKWGMCGI